MKHLTWRWARGGFAERNGGMTKMRKLVNLGLIALVLGGCAGVQLPQTEGKATFTDEGKIKEMSYKSTKAQSGFEGEYDPKTNKFYIKSDKADSPRGYEDYIQAQMQVELKRLELYDKMFKAAIEGGKSAAPGP